MAPDLSWAPSYQVFRRRIMLTSAATFAGLLLVGVFASFLLSLPLFWTVPTAAILTAGYMLEDMLNWRRARENRWALRDGYLVHDGPDGQARIPLTDIESVTVRFGTRVIVGLTSGQQVLIRYLPHATDTARQLQQVLFDQRSQPGKRK